MSLGPLMMDLAGLGITAVEREMLSHPQTGGVILFTRNYESPKQLQALVKSIHALRDPHLIVAVDHEGGRVQRFRDGFTPIPPMAHLGELYDHDAERSLQIAKRVGWLLAVELRAAGVDISFAPVLDLKRGVSGVIGDRAFHRDPDVVTELAAAFVEGMNRAGMAATAKHFPGHGSVREDSHVSRPIDKRSLAEIMSRDMRPFKRMIQRGLPSIMTAHVVYSSVDSVPVTYSRHWLQRILRRQLNFQGVVFSDDLTMAAAEMTGGFTERAARALTAGCDMVPVCNQPEGAARVLDGLEHYTNPTSQLRFVRLHGREQLTLEELQRTAAWRQAHALVEKLNDSPYIEMNL